MFSRTKTAHLIGIQAVIVEVEIFIGSMGLPSFAVVGLAEGAVKESRERVKASLKSLDFNIFAKPITINLAPADFKKEGTHYDLPIAIGLLMASGHIKGNIDDTLFIGELSLDGQLRGVPGILSMVIEAKDKGIKRIILSDMNAVEASVIEDIDIYNFRSLSDVIGFLNQSFDKKPFKRDSLSKTIQSEDFSDFIDVKGQFVARRTAEIAAAGMHNILFIGPPGSGKSMISRRIPGILPKMSFEEAIETTRIHSVSAVVRREEGIITTRPFIAPHHTASDVAIIGGTRGAKPGLVSLAHNGVLFLDELLEFKRTVLEVLRQPLEDGVVIISRANRTMSYPSRFMLVAACNPCPCGFLGDNLRECKCSYTSIKNYRSKLSGPLIDRIDLHINVPSIDFKELSQVEYGEPSKSIRERVEHVHRKQENRFKNLKINFNSQMVSNHIKKYCKLDKESSLLLENIVRKRGLTARAYNKIIKIARTIADLDDSINIERGHLLEATQYRSEDFN